MNLWQEKDIGNLVSFCNPNKDVLALILFGSCCQADLGFDYWSDVDVLLVVKKNALSDFYPTIDWLRVFGPIYTYSQSSDEFMNVTRVCFEDFQRIDLVISTEDQFAEVDNWPRNPLVYGWYILLLRSEMVNQKLHQVTQKYQYDPPLNDQFQSMVRDFRFKSMLAVYKVVRNDLLIALHLTLDLVRDYCLLGMMLRYNKERTTIHKSGGIGNQIVKQLQNTSKPFTPEGILDLVEEINLEFEQLACKWSDGYQENRQPIIDWIAKARIELAS